MQIAGKGVHGGSANEVWSEVRVSAYVATGAGAAGVVGAVHQLTPPPASCTHTYTHTLPSWANCQLIALFTLLVFAAGAATDGSLLVTANESV